MCVFYSSLMVDDAQYSNFYIFSISYAFLSECKRTSVQKTDFLLESHRRDKDKISRIFLKDVMKKIKFNSDKKS